MRFCGVHEHYRPRSGYQLAILIRSSYASAASSFSHVDETWLSQSSIERKASGIDSAYFSILAAAPMRFLSALPRDSRFAGSRPLILCLVRRHGPLM